MENDRVSLVKFGVDLHQTLSQGLQLIDFQVPSDKPILIKPNLCTEVDKTGASTTNIPFIKALINIILEEDRTASVRIIESNSGMKNVEVAFKNLGYTHLVNEFQEQGFDVSLINLSEEPLTTVAHKGLYFKEISLPTILVEPKFLISVAKANLQALTSENAAGKTFNVGTGKAIKICDLAETLIKLLTVRSKPVYEEKREGDIEFIYAETLETFKMLGFKAETVLKTGLQKIINTFI